MALRIMKYRFSLVVAWGLGILLLQSTASLASSPLAVSAYGIRCFDPADLSLSQNPRPILFVSYITGGAEAVFLGKLAQYFAGPQAISIEKILFQEEALADRPVELNGLIDIFGYAFKIKFENSKLEQIVERPEAGDDVLPLRLKWTDRKESGKELYLSCKVRKY